MTTNEKFDCINSQIIAKFSYVLFNFRGAFYLLIKNTLTIILNNGANTVFLVFTQIFSAKLPSSGDLHYLKHTKTPYEF